MVMLVVALLPEAMVAQQEEPSPAWAPVAHSSPRERRERIAGVFIIGFYVGEREYLCPGDKSPNNRAL
jgi:hypothetical protein